MTAELVIRLEGATEATREIDAAIAIAFGGYSQQQGSWVAKDERSAYVTPPPYTSSLDAALTLVPTGTFWRWLVDKRPGAGDLRDDGYRAHVWCGVNPSYEATETWARTPALALCIAAIKARNAMKDQQ